MRLIWTLSFGFFITLLSYILFSFFWSDTGSRESLRVYTYSSFASSWGPGGELAKRFEERFHVKIEFIDVGEAGLLIERVKLESSLEKVDVVVGLDQFLLPDADEKIQWENPDITRNNWDHIFLEFSPDTVERGKFIPFNWGPLAFVAQKREQLPEVRNFEGLLKKNFKQNIGLQDPRTSTPGLQFLFWVIAVKGEQEGFAYLKQLFKQVHSISPSWGKAYGLYQKGNLKTTFSYLTSPIYHWKEEGKKNHYAMIFDEGHIVQVEYLAIPKGTKKKALAKRFVKYLLSEEAQSIIMKKNFMLPVTGGVREKTLFESLPRVKLLKKSKIESLLFKKKKLIDKWVEIRRQSE